MLPNGLVSKPDPESEPGDEVDGVVDVGAVTSVGAAVVCAATDVAEMLESSSVWAEEVEAAAEEEEEEEDAFVEVLGAVDVVVVLGATAVVDVGLDEVVSGVSLEM